MASSSEKKVVKYVAAFMRWQTLQAQDPADMADYEHSLKQARAERLALDATLSGGELAEAKRRGAK